MKLISVIIVTYNSEKDICPCIDSIAINSDLDIDSIEIIVVDNSAKDVSQRTGDILFSRYANRVQYHSMNANLGYGKGNNFGSNLASAEIICIMNPDARLIEPLFRKVVSSFAKNSKLGMLGFRQIGGANLSFYLLPHILIPLFGPMILNACNRLNWYSSKIFFTSGALAFINKDKFQEVGGYDKNIFLYYEDSDLSKRLEDIGYESRFDPSASYRHNVNLAERRERSEHSWSIEFDSLLYYLSKHGISKKWYFIKKTIDFRLKSLIYPIIGRSTKAHLEREFNVFQKKFSNL